MRHKYETRGIVLARSHKGEASVLVTLLTTDLGFVHVRAQSLRKPGAKLAAALVTFAESNVMLVRGKEGWRLTGAVLEENWFVRLGQHAVRERAARVTGLFLRLVVGEEQDARLYPIMRSFFETLSSTPSEAHEAVEILTVLRTLSALGLDAGDLPAGAPTLTPACLEDVLANRAVYIGRINTGLTASGL